jgi:hypothetical protein
MEEDERVTLDGEELKREIDEVLEEIDLVEAEVLELFADIGGDEALRRVVAYKRAQEKQSPLTRSAETKGTPPSPSIPQNED